MAEIQSRFITVEGINTHYLEAGAGPTLVLLHSGEFGGCAELSWEFNIAALAEHFHVIAPDWLGFGGTDKLYDFIAGHRRMLQHMVGFLAAMNINEADFLGNSMGGTFLARVAASEQPIFPYSADDSGQRRRTGPGQRTSSGPARLRLYTGCHAAVIKGSDARSKMGRRCCLC